MGVIRLAFLGARVTPFCLPGGVEAESPPTEKGELMGINIKPLADLAKKFVQRGQAAGPEYEAGVKAPTKDWAAETAAAEGNFTAGIQGAIAKGSFGKGVSAAGTVKWQEKAKTKGVRNFVPGIAAAGADWQKGFAPIADALSRLTLPPRGQKGASQNIERVRAVDTAAREAAQK